MEPVQDVLTQHGAGTENSVSVWRDFLPGTHIIICMCMYTLYVVIEYMYVPLDGALKNCDL